MSPPATVDALRSVPLLAGLPEKELKNLAGSLRERTYHEGETVVEEGSGGVGFFMILDGSAEVSIRGERRGTMKTGDHFGELGLLDDSVGRQATVKAIGELTCAGLTSWQFKPFLAEHPDIAWTLMRQMATRLAETERFHSGNGGK